MTKYEYSKEGSGETGRQNLYIGSGSKSLELHRVATQGDKKFLESSPQFPNSTENTIW